MLGLFRNMYDVHVCFYIICFMLYVICFRAYTSGLIRSVLVRTFFDEDNQYQSFETISKHLNKTSHKICFVVVRDNVGSTTFGFPEAANDANMQHSFGVPRFFFRFNLTSAICDQPYSYVHWVMFKLNKIHRTSFEGSMSRNEWRTGPTERPNINPFCYLEDMIPSRYALGMYCALRCLNYLMRICICRFR